ncbi:glycosyltransferase [Candidatus Woesearchaeota archaeon]|nr:glycosyltransferase [Candidatus Woesearchaeota archaeon]
MFSIVIPAYNEEKYISSTLDSIKSQDFKDYEIIVVCNGCTDKTFNIAKKYTKNAIELKERNVIKAKNKGASLSRYDKIIFLDADTRFKDDNALSKISKNNNEISTCFFLPDKISLKYLLFGIAKNFFSLFGAANGIIICNKKDFIRVNGFDNNIYPLENRNLIKKIRKISRFRVVPTFVITSMRRHNRWGLYGLFYWSNTILFNRKKEYEAVR